MRRTVLPLALVPVLALAAGCGAIGGLEAHPDALTGKITYNGQPVKSVALTVTGPDGKPSGGATNDEGVYTIPNPPKGTLQIQLSAPGGKAAFPVKYTKPNSGLSVAYTGGRLTHNIDLTP
ncbi:carboxypeptidase-like regulatory domain-containing protein [Frigoriglobus tundricola]|uniref:Carboxypeptidase regulatory-like domain-containing protein n=1 Tax=Frigoriglobus tundricola TaxID=2774151 RepID=A0A6M5YT88_9BACT|nr:carboxypeptidase-like regulatory domain-containing protein [Frigoriglobus tundricola]QJW96610.1 hypothetical protein FTUN_4167 [Frigoriglobus tundricola]